MRFAGIAVLGLGALLASQAQAQNFSNIYFFGDSNTDSGRYLYLPQTKNNPATFATVGGYTTNPGPMYSVALGSYFGFAVVPSDSPTGGNNYAAGGARVVFQGNNSNAWSTQSQIAAFLALTGGLADPNALYVFSIGVNDLKTSTTGGPGNIVNPVNTAAITTLGQQAAAQVTGLAAAGARYIIVPNTVSIRSAAAGAASGFGFGTGTQNSATSRALYDQVLWSTLAANRVNFIPADFNTVYNYVLVNPAPFGITVTSVNTPACGPTVGSPNCGPANYTTPNADKTYFYADGPNSSTGGGHLASAMQKVQADYYYSLIVAPSQISFLAEIPIKTRVAVINSIFNQIPLSWGQAGSFHGWASGDVSAFKAKNYAGFPDDPGVPTTVTAGFDYRVSRNWLLGAAFSGSTTTQSYSPLGNYKQDEFSASFYSAFRIESFWLNAIGTWGSLRDTTNRDVQLGITVQSNTGSTRGTDVSLAIEVGYDFGAGAVAPSLPNGLPVKAPLMAAGPAFVHGPVVGITLQQVRIDGFTEFNPAGLTALAFDSQRRDSAVTALGYQAYMTLGMWQPYAKLVWNHELASLDRQVTASLTTIVAPAFSMPAVAFGRDWGTATVGTRVMFAPNVAAYAAFIGQFGERDVQNYGGQVGLNVSFDWGAVVAKY